MQAFHFPVDAERCRVDQDSSTGEDRVMNVIFLGGGGINNTAMIVRMYLRRNPIDLILFVGPGSAAYRSLFAGGMNDDHW